MQPLQPATTPDQPPPVDLLRALGQRGVSALADVLAMRRTGRSRPGHAPVEYEFELRFTTACGATVTTTARQFMSPAALVGLAPGRPATIFHDRVNPAALVVRRSPQATLAAIAGAAAFSAVAAAERAA